MTDDRVTLETLNARLVRIETLIETLMERTVSGEHCDGRYLLLVERIDELRREQAALRAKGWWVATTIGGAMLACLAKLFVL
jgi:hypothetical protein